MKIDRLYENNLNKTLFENPHLQKTATSLYQISVGGHPVTYNHNGKEIIRDTWSGDFSIIFYKNITSLEGSPEHIVGR